MATVKKYTTEEILNYKFKPAEKGYDPLEVDEVFDAVIEEINALEKSIKNGADINEKLHNEIHNLKEELERKVVEIAKLKQQNTNIISSLGINQDNYKLMKKVTAYEKVLYRKGIDLNKALSDPDNC